MKFSFFIVAVIALFSGITYVNFNSYREVTADNIAHSTLEEIVKLTVQNESEIFAVSNVQKRIPVLEMSLPADVVVKRIISLQPFLLDVIVYHSGGNREFHYENISGDKVFSVCKRPC